MNATTSYSATILSELAPASEFKKDRTYYTYLGNSF